MQPYAPSILFPVLQPAIGPVKSTQPRSASRDHLVHPIQLHQTVDRRPRRRMPAATGLKTFFCFKLGYLLSSIRPRHSSYSKLSKSSNVHGTTESCLVRFRVPNGFFPTRRCLIEAIQVPGCLEELKRQDLPLLWVGLAPKEAAQCIKQRTRKKPWSTFPNPNRPINCHYTRSREGPLPEETE